MIVKAVEIIALKLRLVITTKHVHTGYFFYCSHISKIRQKSSLNPILSPDEGFIPKFLVFSNQQFMPELLRACYTFPRFLNWTIYRVREGLMMWFWYQVKVIERPCEWNIVSPNRMQKIQDLGVHSFSANFFRKNV